jgi:hypothetical protein
VPISACRGVFIESVAPISSLFPVLPQAEVQKASTPMSAKSTPAPADTGFDQHCRHKSASAGDADHDSDSH